MKVVITGGNGYIGARLSQYLANRGDQVIPVCFPGVPNNEVWKNKMFTTIEGDLRDDTIIKQISDFNPDAIIHLVSLDHFDSEKDPKYVNDINVLPTWRLLDAGVKIGLKKFIYFSTIQVYGKLPDEIINEEQPIVPTNTYGLTHYLSERICDHYNRNFSTDVISVRLSNSYGDPIFPENNCWWLAINDICKGAYYNKEIRLLSDGTPKRDFIHGNDVCEGTRILLNTDCKSNSNSYHLSSGNTLTLLELAQVIKQEYKFRYNESIPIYTPQGLIHESLLLADKRGYTISNLKLRNLGYSPFYSIEMGINELFTYFENN